MRIDLSLIRQILFSIEEEKLSSKYINDVNFISQYKFKDISYYTTNETEKGIFIYHVKYLYAKQLINCEIIKVTDYQYSAKGGIIDLTPDGHELIDKIRHDKIFNKIMEKLHNVGGEISFDIIKSVASKVIIELIG